MIHIQSARNLLNKVSPEIRMHWEKEKKISLSTSIARIEEIEQNKKKTRAKNKRLIYIIFAIIIMCIVIISLSKSTVIPLTVLVISMIWTFGLYDYFMIRVERISLEEENEQNKLSDSVTPFLDTALRVCERNTLPKDRLVDAEYLKEVLHIAIKDLLLKQAVLRMKASNPSFDVDNVAAAAIEYTSADIYLDNQWEIVKDKLGVEMDKKAMFIEAAEEMRKTHPGLSEYIKVE